MSVNGPSSCGSFPSLISGPTASSDASHGTTVQEAPSAEDMCVARGEVRTGRGGTSAAVLSCVRDPWRPWEWGAAPRMMRAARGVLVPHTPRPCTPFPAAPWSPASCSTHLTEARACSRRPPARRAPVQPASRPVWAVWPAHGAVQGAGPRGSQAGPWAGRCRSGRGPPSPAGPGAVRTRPQRPALPSRGKPVHPRLQHTVVRISGDSAAPGSKGSRRKAASRAGSRQSGQCLAHEARARCVPAQPGPAQPGQTTAPTTATSTAPTWF